MNNFLLALIGTVILAACGSKANTIKEPKKADAIPVRIVSIDSGTRSEEIFTSGLLSTEEEAKLSFKVGGVIEKIFVKEGQLVKHGQLLATLKSTEISAQVSQVQLSLEKAQRDYQRASNLYKDSVATLEQFQNAKTGVDLAQKNLQQVAFNQQYSKIYAVSDGFIIKQLLHEGELANPGNPVLYMSSVSGSSRWVLKTGIADREWAAIEKGNKAVVTFDAFPGKKFNAVITRKSMAADPVSGTFQADIAIDFGNLQPATGMFGKATITPLQKTIGFTVPYDALLEAEGKTGYVFVTDDQKTVKRVPVTIASIDNRNLYINDGLQGYQYVVVSGSAFLNEHSMIAVVK